jgi:spore coat protein U-like protein
VIRRWHFATVIPLLAAAAGLFAQTSQTSVELLVSAQVLAICRVYTSAPIEFGTLNPSDEGDKTRNGSVEYKCTKDVQPTLTYDTVDTQNSRDLNGPNGAKLRYRLEVTSAPIGTGFGPSDAKLAVLKATILQTNFARARAGRFEDTVIVTVSF